MMLPALLAQAQAPAAAVGWSDGPGLLRTLLSLIAVLALLGGCLWLIRRGGWQSGFRKGVRPVLVETAVGLGDRRQLVIVSVEGRRLLLGVTPMHVALVTELTAHAGFSDALAARVSVGAASFVPPGEAAQ